MQPIRDYFQRLSDAVGEGWDRFWFTPAAPETVCLLRILVGLAATYLVASYTADLQVWFGPNGLLPVETVRQLTGTVQAGAFAPQSVGRWSYLDYAESSQLLWVLHFAGLAVVIAFALGLYSRITCVLSLAVTLAYLHRAPMIVGPFESVVPIVLFGLCWAPTGSRWSLDAWLARRRMKLPVSTQVAPARSVWANLGQRLVQVHVAALYLLMAATQLAGQTWWAGEAMWWLIARTDSRLVNLSWMNEHMLAINAWTHAIVLFEVLFGLLIWNRVARPLLLVLSIFLWVPLALVTGNVSFCLLMLAVNVSFVSPEFLQVAFAGKPAVAA
jgi:hypothetical protein